MLRKYGSRVLCASRQCLTVRRFHAHGEGTYGYHEVLDKKEKRREKELLEGRIWTGFRRAARRMQYEQKREEERPKYLIPAVNRIEIDRPMNLRELGTLLGVTPHNLLVLLPQEAGFTINDTLSMSTIQEICQDLHVRAIKKVPIVLDPALLLLSTPFDKRPKNKQKTDAKPLPRSPVVTIMGHVDHGKTTLLDALRNTNIVAKEAGGITQHIAAFQVKMDNIAKNIKTNISDTRSVTFIDTPGHEAFVAMRAAGAQVTDIVVLVVAADDGVMPQTEEAIRHARESDVHIIVAINKIDKSNADIESVYKQLTQHGLTPESEGGNVQVVQISALKRQNLDKLIEEISLWAEVSDLSAPRACQMEATVIESRLDKGFGMNVTALVRRGVMKPGQWVVAGTNYGRVRVLRDHNSNQIKQAFPAEPVDIAGFESMPQAGDVILEVESEEQAKHVIEYRLALKKLEREDDIVREEEDKKMKLMYIREKIKKENGVVSSASNSVNAYIRENQEKQKQEKLAVEILEKEQSQGPIAFPIVFRADVAGAIDAFHEIISNFPKDEIYIQIIKEDVGQIAETDIQTAKASNAHIIAMNVKPSEKMQLLAKQNKVIISSFKVIYHMIDHIKKLLSDALPPIINENIIGEAECKEVFHIDDKKISVVAGSVVVSGSIVTSAEFYRVVRYGRVIHDKLPIHSLFHFKDKVKEVKKGLECGIALDGYDEPKKGDKIQAIQTQKVAQDFNQMIEAYKRKVSKDTQNAQYIGSKTKR